MPPLKIEIDINLVQIENSYNYENLCTSTSKTYTTKKIYLSLMDKLYI